MLRNLLLLLPVLALNSLLPAQNPGCDGVRYKQPVFTSVKKTTVPYATTLSHTGQNMTLSMDVYEPLGDTISRRPVVVLAHGGSFIFGDKGDMKKWCELLALRGYVVASIQYRLFPVIVFGFPDSTQIMDTAVKAVGDMKAAVRYFRLDAATANQFRADPDFIFIGGYSAGAVAALHAGYLDADDDIPAFIQGLVNANGGLSGSSGNATNQSYSSKVGAVINMSGGLYRRGWIRDGELPLVSVHGTADQTVPFQSGLAANLAYLEGSGLLHPQALNIGTWSFLKKIPGGGHTNIYDQPQYAAQIDNYWLRATALLEFLTCRADTLPGYVSGTAETLKDEALEWSIFPNPAGQSDNVVFVQLPETSPAATVALYDATGREIRRAMVQQPSGGRTSIPVAGLPAGVYWVRLLPGDMQRSVSGMRMLVLK